MSTDREEIRWKFQVMLENLEMVRDQFENERRFLDERYQRIIRGFQRMRDYWLGGIGFFITLTTAIILAKNMDDIYFVVPVGAAIIAFTIWFITNLKLTKAYLANKEIDDIYYILLNGAFIPLKGMISTYALIDEYSKEDTITLISYVTIFGKAISFKLIPFMDKKLNLKQFRLEDFRQHYELAKSSFDKFKKMNYALGTELIEEFTSEFEKKDKKKSKI